MTPEQKLDTLIAKLEKLRQMHQHTSIEMTKLREDVRLLKRELGRPSEEDLHASRPMLDEIPVAKLSEEEPLPEVDIDFSKTSSTPPPLIPDLKSPKSSVTPKSKAVKAFDLEAFIGGNLINKIGILILIVGLGLFVKYAIDNGYFPPLVRLILSFLAGLTLVSVGYWLKPKYKTYSAVLFSGGMAVLYFSAYGGNAFYDPILLPKITAFILMVVFTIVTVVAAMIYELQIIALLGLVGAYAVPILLSDGTGDYKMLFAYMAIINTGVLLVSIRNKWKATVYTAFILTWLIFSFWVLVEYSTTSDTGTAWLFNLLFFFLFYAALITYNILKKESFSIGHILFITVNAFISYGLGMILLENSDLDQYHGLFTLLSGVLHLGVSFGLYKSTADPKLFHAISGLFWIFLTLAIGIQFGAEVRPLLWLGEAALLFGIGRRFKIRLYEGASLLVLFLGGSLLLEIWTEAYYEGSRHYTALFNRYFLVSMLALGISGVLLWTKNKWRTNWSLSPIIDVVIPLFFIGILYLSFFHEIYHQFDQAYLNSEIQQRYHYSIRNFGVIWLLNYSISFILGMLLLNHFYLKNRNFGRFAMLLGSFVVFLFLTLGMLTLNELRTSYLDPDYTPNHVETTMWIWIRYITYVFVAGLLYGIYKSLHWLGQIKNGNIFFQLFLYLIILVVLSNELTTFMRLVVGVDTSSLTHRVGFSILWGLYSLMMVLVGFKQRSKLIRVAGIVLFGITLLKVFFMDLIDISIESKILLFVAIGVLLLITSYLYQRYKDVLVGEEEKEEIKSEDS